jgi:hypothetical protein
VQPVMPLSLAEIDGADDVEDLGEIPFIAEDRQRPPEARGPRAPDDSTGESPGPADDEGPGHARKEWRKQQQPGRAPRGAVRALRITAGIRADINAKVSMPLEVLGQIWKARDPLCGGTFLQQRPEIAESFTDIICDSADLVAFFTGPAGKFMKYLNVGAALWPVIEVGAAHHVYHTIAVEAPDGDAEAMTGRYAA